MIKNIRIARYPAGLDFISNGEELKNLLTELFTTKVVDFKTETTPTGVHWLTFVIYPGYEDFVQKALSTWMEALTINYTTQAEILLKLEADGKEVTRRQISSLGITIDDVLYEDVAPITNMVKGHRIELTSTSNIKNSTDYAYLKLMRHVQEEGKLKTDRTGTGTISDFGYQMRFDLNEGIPLLTTKKVHLKSVIHELIWFLNGDTNIKYLNDNGVSIWDEWADENGDLGPVYGAQWRNWLDTQMLHPVRHEKEIEAYLKRGYMIVGRGRYDVVADEYLILQKFHDQIKDVLDTLKNNPDSRRIIVSSWNVPEIPNMKLAPCHSLFQFDVVNLTPNERAEYYTAQTGNYIKTPATHELYDQYDVPRQRLSCQLYQRSIN